MINHGHIQNCEVSFPVLEGLVNKGSLTKIELRDLSQQWRGETLRELADNYEGNPYSIRIGFPHVDQQLREDRVFFILNYLSFNPLTKKVELRELAPYRNMDRVYIGQSVDEGYYDKYKLFVNGNIVADDIFLKKNDNLKDMPLATVITNLINKVEQLQREVYTLRAQAKTNLFIPKDSVK